MAESLILAPLLGALVALVVPSNRWRPWILPVAGLVFAVLTVLALGSTQPVEAFDKWLVLDPVGKVVLGVVAVVFLACSFYAPGYLALRQERPNRVLCACLLLSLAMMTLVILSHHLGLMWVAMEATTLATAPLIFFNHNSRSLEATWKYLLIGSVGIALALLGSFFLAYASFQEGETESSLLFEHLLANASTLSRPWLHAAFVLLLIGYGTKMGLAPMHTWKPDAYGEAPGVVGALLASGLTGCAFLAVLRFVQICDRANDIGFARELLLFFGLLSMAVGAVFLVRQRDFKRMLAYSSVENMGILVLGIGLGGIGIYGSVLHLVNNALTKGVLFLSAGNIRRAYNSKSTNDVQGALKRLPVSACLFLAGFFALTGAPPFGPFLSEFTIARAALGSGRFVVGGMFLLLVIMVFIAMGATVLAVVQGEPSEKARSQPYRDGWLTAAPVVVLLALVLLMGVWIPGPVQGLLEEAARDLGMPAQPWMTAGEGGTSTLAAAGTELPEVP